MSRKYPIIAITGSSGSRKDNVCATFEHLAKRENAKLSVMEGNGFHRYDRAAFRKQLMRSSINHKRVSHFAPDANLFDRLDEALTQYGQDGTGLHRRYLHTLSKAALYDQQPGTFSPWEEIPRDVDLLLYQGLHGCFQSDEYDIAKHMDLKIGMVPIVNLEWIQKIHRDTGERGYSAEAVADTIMRRMNDYVSYIAPQFSVTDINFQQVPIVDSSNPFAERDVPNEHECVVVIRESREGRARVDFSNLINVVSGSFMSRTNTIVVPGYQLENAMEHILAPLIHELIEGRRGAG